MISDASADCHTEVRKSATTVDPASPSATDGAAREMELPGHPGSENDSRPRRPNLRAMQKAGLIRLTLTERIQRRQYQHTLRALRKAGLVP